MIQNFPSENILMLGKMITFSGLEADNRGYKKKEEELDYPRKWVQEHAIISPVGLAELETLQARPRFDAVLRVVNTFGWDIIIC
ncbi:hypothetical protein JOC77_004367 [Peribacillus deserti]|uniref:Uncharacterized protein n=1 Tax=Peribacillus deserti TaxID=673318 RepID=A0ABS2QNY8_9BACI|nr:hypothetical protein [Peribacillus deserti]MBM7694888.1 hypothetical protein [Peribacillus deserti]